MRLPTETQVEALILVLCAAVFAAVASALRSQPPVPVGPWTLTSWCAGFFAVALFAAVVLLVTED